MTTLQILVPMSNAYTYGTQYHTHHLILSTQCIFCTLLHLLDLLVYMWRLSYFVFWYLQMYTSHSPVSVVYSVLHPRYLPLYLRDILWQRVCTRVVIQSIICNLRIGFITTVTIGMKHATRCNSYNNATNKYN